MLYKHVLTEIEAYKSIHLMKNGSRRERKVRRCVLEAFEMREILNTTKLVCFAINIRFPGKERAHLVVLSKHKSFWQRVRALQSPYTRPHSEAFCKNSTHTDALGMRVCCRQTIFSLFHFSLIQTELNFQQFKLR